MEQRNAFRFCSLLIFLIGFAISEKSFPEVVIKFKTSCEANCIDEFAKFHGLTARVSQGNGYFRFKKMRQQNNINEMNGVPTSFRGISLEEMRALVSSSSTSGSVIEKVLPQIPKVRHKRRATDVSNYNDPEWGRMWYLNDKIEGVTMNVERVWKRGYTGANVVVAVVADGIEIDHPELVDNFDLSASYDFVDNDPNPDVTISPLLSSLSFGTCSAGIIAAAPNNSLCGVGIAHGARIGGIRMRKVDVDSGGGRDKNGDVDFDRLASIALSFNFDYVDIYSSAWGPKDDGKVVVGPGPLTKIALRHGVYSGRGGRGSIFVWAAGNGGLSGDTCACDGYVNSPFTIAVSAVDRKGLSTFNSELCPAIMAVTYASSDSGSIICPDIGHQCKEENLPSVAAPIAAGILALVLEANSSLTWRDLQHLIVKTSISDRIGYDWKTNGVGKRFSNKFGFGLLDADALVTAALSWESVDHAYKDTWVADHNLNKTFDEKELYEVVINIISGRISRCEHVMPEVTLNTEYRGDNEIKLVSPSGTSSTLLLRRLYDTSKEGFSKWSFLSVHFWGENPKGTWTLQIKTSESKSSLQAFTLAILGTI